MASLEQAESIIITAKRGSKCLQGKTAVTDCTQWAPGCTAARTEHVSPQFCAQVQRDDHNSFDSDDSGGKLQIDHKNADIRYLPSFRHSCIHSNMMAKR